MYIITTRNFPPQVGGIQTLMYGIAKNLSKLKEVKVFADDFTGSKDFDAKQNFSTERVRGLKFIRKFRKANLINNYISENKKVEGIISDHWKSIEKISKNVCHQINTICLIHGKEINHENKSPLLIRMLNSLEKSKYIIANSEFTKKLAISKGIPEGKIHVIHPGIFLEENISSENLEKAEAIYAKGKPRILTVARLDKRKSIDQTLLALKNFQSKYQDFIYVVCGDGEEYDNLKRLSDNLDLNQNVIFLSDISQDLKNALIKKSDIFVMPSIQFEKSVEGFGIVYAEAAKYGVPSIGGLLGGASDAIQNNETGILCDGEKHEEIYKALIEMFTNDKFKIMGEKAKQFSEKFSWDNQIKKYLNLLEE